MKKLDLLKSLFVFSALLFVQSGMFAENEKVSLTVEDAVKIALENNKTLKSNAIDLELKKRASDYSWNMLLPSVAVNGTLSRSNTWSDSSASMSMLANGYITSDMKMLQTLGTALETTPYTDAAKMMNLMAEEMSKHLMTPGEETEAAHWKAVGNVSLSWNFSLAMVESIRTSKAQYESGKITWEKQNKDMEVNIKKLFYGLLLAQESLKIDKESLANAKARYEQANINYKNGLVPELQVLNSQVSYENKKPNVLKNEQGLKQQLDLFAFMLGYPFGTEIELIGSIDMDYVNADVDEIYNSYCASSNEILSLKKNIEVAKTGLNALYFSTYTPALAVSYGFQPVVTNIENNWFEKLDTSTGEGNWMDNGSLSFTLAFTNLVGMLPFSSTYQKIKDTKQQIKQAEIGLEMLLQNSEVEIHKLVDNLEVSKQNIEAMKRNIDVAEKAYASTLKGFNNGTQEWLSVKESDSALSQAKLGLMSEKFNYISAVLELENKANIKLSK